jgi:hypothetical protein
MVESRRDIPRHLAARHNYTTKARSSSYRRFGIVIPSLRDYLSRNHQADRAIMSESRRAPSKTLAESGPLIKLEGIPEKADALYAADGDQPFPGTHSTGGDV